MQLSELDDKNTTLEVYLEYLCKNTETQFEKIGHIVIDEDFGIYHTFGRNRRYVIISTDPKIYSDKRFKNKYKKEKKSTMFLYPVNEKYEFADEKSLMALIAYFSGHTTDLILGQMNDIQTVKKYLEY